MAGASGRVRRRPRELKCWSTSICGEKGDRCWRIWIGMLDGRSLRQMGVASHYGKQVEARTRGRFKDFERPTVTGLLQNYPTKRYSSFFFWTVEHIECADDPGGRNCFSDDAAFCGGFRRTGAKAADSVSDCAGGRRADTGFCPRNPEDPS